MTGLRGATAFAARAGVAQTFALGRDATARKGGCVWVQVHQPPDCISPIADFTGCRMLGVACVVECVWVKVHRPPEGVSLIADHTGCRLPGVRTGASAPAAGGCQPDS